MKKLAVLTLAAVFSVSAFAADMAAEPAAEMQTTAAPKTEKMEKHAAKKHHLHAKKAAAAEPVTTA